MIASAPWRGLRGRLWLGTVLVTLAALALTVGAFNVLLAYRLDANANDAARSRAVAKLSGLSITSGAVSLGEAPDAAIVDAPVWVFSHGRVLEQPLAPPAVELAARRLAAGGRASFADVAGQATRLYDLPLRDHASTAGSVVAAVSLTPYEQTRRTALLASLALALLMLAGVALAAHALLSRALQPVARMTRDAAAWSEHDLDQRFDAGDAGDELGQLAATLDDLLDRIAQSLRREQRFTAELSHELRTPLARIRTEAELALRTQRDDLAYRDALASILRNAEQLGRIVDSLLAAARHELDPTRETADAQRAAANVVTACLPTADDRGVRLQLTEPLGATRVACDQELVERILQPVIENACRYGRTRATITVSSLPASVRVTVTDDGPGIRTEEVDQIFEPGVRGHAAECVDTSGAGLGLSLARRLALVAGAVVTARPEVGGHFTITFPAAPGTASSAPQSDKPAAIPAPVA